MKPQIPDPEVMQSKNPSGCSLYASLNKFIPNKRKMKKKEADFAL
jgi:hypothetical protein